MTFKRLVSQRSSFVMERGLSLFLMLVIVLFVLVPSRHIPNYSAYAISDWLINYQGGFVRRGLIGELLWLAFQVHPFPVRYFIVGFDVVCFCGLACIVYRVFHRHGWSLIAALVPYACCMCLLTGYRRDFLMLCLCYFIFNLFFTYFKRRNRLYLIAGLTVMSLAILIYEPVFFVLLPVSALLCWSCFEGSKGQKVIRLLVCFSIPVICMFFCCVSKGDPDMATAIWDSWKPLFLAYPDSGSIPPMGLGVGFLKLTLSEAFSHHIETNFGYSSWPSLHSVMGNVASVTMFLCVYFLVTRTWIVEQQRQILRQNRDYLLLSNFFLFQCVMMLPMFTVLSCDYGRSIPFCVITTFFMTHLCKKYKVDIAFPGFLTRVSDKLQSMIGQREMLKSPLFYCMVALLMPLRFCWAFSLSDNVLVHFIDKIIKYWPL